MLNIYLNTWGNYNTNGADGGEWVSLPMDADELETTMARIAEAMGDHDPEWFINDFEIIADINFEIHEMDNIHDLNSLCDELSSMSEYEQEETAAAMEVFGYSLSEAVEKVQRGCFVFYGGWDLEDLAYDIVENCYTLEGPLQHYFDYKAFARDLGFDGYYETSYGVIYE